VRLHGREPIGGASRGLKKLLQRSGLTRELRKRGHDEKPCEAPRRAKVRQESAVGAGRVQTRAGSSR